MSLAASLTVDAAEDDVAFALRVENDGGDPVELTFGSGQTAEFVVSGSDGVVWRWSDGRMFTQRVWTETLAPGEELVADAAWADPDPGSYSVEATLVATDHRPTASATFDV